MDKFTNDMTWNNNLANFMNFKHFGQYSVNFSYSGSKNVTIMAIMQIFGCCRRPSATIENLVPAHIMQILMVASATIRWLQKTFCNC